MKLKVLISLLFMIMTTFASIHEVQHVEHSDDTLCLVCHVNSNLMSADIVDTIQDVEIFHFEKILEEHSVLSLHIKKYSNQNRAPPLTS